MSRDISGTITLNREFCNVGHNTDDMKNHVYPDLQTNTDNKEWLCERALLAPTNEIVERINENIMSQVQGDIWSVTQLIIWIQNR